MAKSSLNSEIRNRIDAFAEELAGLVRQAAFESLHEALGADGGQIGRRRPGRPKGTRRKTGARRGRPGRPPSAATEALTPKVLAHVKANDGASVSEIASALKKQSAAVKPAIARLLAEKKLRKTGQRRGTKYHARS